MKGESHWSPVPAKASARRLRWRWQNAAQVIATDLAPPHETARRIGPTAHALQLDVTQEEQWRSAAARIRDVGEVDNRRE
ncbi:MAG TPA: hypothetical protein VKU01_27715 [Bryobacteraceae bacterium]|nr:hypothetical protein [Bryobacteraceae bacterium]